MGSEVGPSFEDSAKVLSSTRLSCKMVKTEFDKIRKVIIINYITNVVRYDRKNIQIFVTGVTTHWNSYSCEMKNSRVFGKINNFPNKEHRQTPKHTGKLKMLSQQCVGKKNYQVLGKRLKNSQKLVSQMSVISELHRYISVIFMNVI